MEDIRPLSPLLRELTTERMVLGVLGTRSSTRLADLEIQVLAPMVEAWGIPDELLLPAGSDSTAALQTWAAQKEIPVRLLVADWFSHGRRASILRDATIQREATHLVLLQGPRSDALAKLGRRLVRKGRHVIISERPGEPVKSVSPK